MFVLSKIIEGCLYAIKIIAEAQDLEDKDETDESYNAQDEFERLFSNWSDTAYLYEFFEVNYNDLNSGYYKEKFSIEQAVFRTLEEAALLEQKLYNIAEKGQNHPLVNLQNIFKPLHKNENHVYPPPSLQHSKAYGTQRRSWLRVYALRIDKNLFIITGGAIKLTRDMNTRQHLIAELDKLNHVKQFLITQNIIDIDSLTEFLEIDL